MVNYKNVENTITGRLHDVGKKMPESCTKNSVDFVVHDRDCTARDFCGS
jgi:hypothetical protein